jgi:hypothetical protein
MNLTTDHSLILVELEDEFGAPIGQTVDVIIEFVREVDCSYGEDADGQRGTTLVSYHLLDAYIIDSQALRQLTAAQAEEAILIARQRFEEAPKHFV